MLGKALQPEIRQMIADRAFDDLRESLAELEIADIAEIIEDLPSEDHAVLFRLLAREVAAEVFEHLEFEAQENLLRHLSMETVAGILNQMAADDRTRLLEELPGEVTRRLLKMLDPGELKVARSLLGYPEESIGRLMTPEYIAMRPEWTVERAFREIREQASRAETLTYVYVVDERGRLIDDLGLARLVLADPAALLSDLVERNFVALSATDDREVAVLAFKKYDRSALPVLDGTGVLLGIVTVDDMLDVEEVEATEDVQVFGGQAALEDGYFQTSNLELARKRVGWLTILFVGGFFTSWAMEHFGPLLDHFVVLAFFVPLVISSGGNSGTQSASMIIRALATQDVLPSDWRRVLGREILIGIGMGMMLGCILSARVLLSAPDRPLAYVAVMHLAVTGVVALGTVSGAIIPFVFKRVGMDPAVCSGPFIATFLDFTGLMLYLSLARWVLG